MTHTQSAPMGEQELKPCPFCGSDPYVTQDDGRYCISCSECYCCVGEAYDAHAMPEHMFFSEEQAATAWNTRAAASPRLAGREEIARVLWASEFDVEHYPWDKVKADEQKQYYRFADAILSLLGPAPSEGVGPHTIDHDGFTGDVIGHYVTREGKRGVVLQQVGTRVVHVYGEKWLKDTPPTSHASQVLGSDDNA